MNEYEDNEILAEIRRIKDEIGAEFNYDVFAIGKHLREEALRNGHIYHRPNPDGSTTLVQYGKDIAFFPAGVDYKDVLQQLAAPK